MAHTMWKYLSLLLIVLLAAGTVVAQEKKKMDPAKAAAWSELRTELVSFMKTTAMPAMLRWKVKLDAAMSSEDLQALNKLRAEAATVKARTQEDSKGVKEAWNAEDYSALKQHRDGLKQLTEERKGLLEDLKPIAVKYKDVLVDLGQKAKPAVDGWKEEGKNIVTAWVQKHKDTFGLDGMQQAIAFIKKKFDVFGQFDADTKKKLAAARFMLWDGSDFTRFIDDAGQGMPGFGGPSGDMTR